MFPKIWKTETVELLDKDGKILATLNHVPGLYGLSKKIHVSTFLQDYIHNVTPALLAFNVTLHKAIAEACSSHGISAQDLDPVTMKAWQERYKMALRSYNLTREDLHLAAGLLRGSVLTMSNSKDPIIVDQLLE